MKIKSRCFPYGSLPYDNPESVTTMMAKLFSDVPYLPVLPLIYPEDTVQKRTLSKIPGVKGKDKKVVLKTTSKHYKNDLLKLDVTFNSTDFALLDAYSIDSEYLNQFLQVIKKFKSTTACVNLLGPFSVSQLLMESSEEQFLTDKSYRKLFIQAICVKAMWIIEKIKEACPATRPLIMLEEPLYEKLGDVKRENEGITVELVTNLFAKIVEKIKSAGADVGVHCMGKCDWKIPINAGVDMIYFDAYNNPNNLSIIPESIIEFVERGGKICWGIVPTTNEAIVKSLNVDYLTNRLFATMENLILAGVPERFVYNSALVAIQGDVSHLSLIFAEKALILVSQISKKIPVKS